MGRGNPHKANTGLALDEYGVVGQDWKTASGGRQRQRALPRSAPPASTIATSPSMNADAWTGVRP